MIFISYLESSSPMASSADKNPSTTKFVSDVNEDFLPEGFVVVVGPDGYRYIVPESLGPALEHQFRGEQIKFDNKVFQASGIVSIFIPPSFFIPQCEYTVSTACRVLEIYCMPVTQ